MTRFQRIAACGALSALVLAQGAWGQESAPEKTDETKAESNQEATPRGSSNDGQGDLDRATELNLSAESVGDLTEVIKYCRSALKQGLDTSNEPIAKTLLAGALTQKSEAVVRKIFSSNPPPRQWNEMRKLAEGDLDESISLKPEQPDAHFRIAQLNLMPGGDVKRAQQALDDGLKHVDTKSPGRVKFLVLRGKLGSDAVQQEADLNEALKLAPKVDHEPIYRSRALFYMQRGQLDKALADLDKAVELDPRIAGTHEARGVVLFNLGRVEEAMGSFERTLSLSADSPMSSTYKARILAAAGQTRAAIKEVEKVLKKHPSAAGLLLMRAELLRSRGDFKKALDDVEQVLRQRPGTAEALKLRATLAAETGRFEQVQTDLAELKKLIDNDVQYLLMAGTIYAIGRKPELSVEAFTEVIEKDPKQWQAYRGRADALLNQGKQAEALKDYEEGLKLQPKDANMLNNVAWVMATSTNDKLRDGKRAIEVATAACEVTRYQQGHIVSTLAAAHAEAGDFENAKKWSKAALELATVPALRSQLNKELAGYKNNKPWRESKTPMQPIAKPDEADTADSTTKSDEPKDQTKPDEKGEEKPKEPAATDETKEDKPKDEPKSSGEDPIFDEK